MFFLVPLYSTCSSIQNLQSIRSIQLFVMVAFSCAAYAGNHVANYFISDRGDIVSAFGAFVIGICGNVYSRLGGGTAFTSMVTGVLFLVPVSLAAVAVYPKPVAAIRPVTCPSPFLFPLPAAPGHTQCVRTLTCFSRGRHIVRYRKWGWAHSELQHLRRSVYRHLRTRHSYDSSRDRGHHRALRLADPGVRTRTAQERGALRVLST